VLSRSLIGEPFPEDNNSQEPRRERSRQPPWVMSSAHNIHDASQPTVACSRWDIKRCGSPRVALPGRFKIGIVDNIRFDGCLRQRLSRHSCAIERKRARSAPSATSRDAMVCRRYRVGGRRREVHFWRCRAKNGPPGALLPSRHRRQTIASREVALVTLRARLRSIAS